MCHGHRSVTEIIFAAMVLCCVSVLWVSVHVHHVWFASVYCLIYHALFPCHEEEKKKYIYLSISVCVCVCVCVCNNGGLRNTL